MNIIVNGGTRGIGKEVVKYLAGDLNHRIFVTGRNRKMLEELSAKFENVFTMQIDLSEFDSFADAYSKKIQELFINVDTLINIAGSIIVRPFSEFTNKEARLLMEVNFIAPASIIRIVKPYMNNNSHIVNISSMGGFQGSLKYNGLSYYSSSKASLACLSECLAYEFKDSGVNVNCLCLGSVQTEMLNEAFPGFKAPVGVEEMAEFISDFALKGHRYFNGKILPVAIGNP